MKVHPALLALTFVAVGLVEVQDWPSTPARPQASLSELARFALHGHPSREASASLPEMDQFPARPAVVTGPDRELTAPPHAHAHLRTGS